jgi:hypothetical protein
MVNSSCPGPFNGVLNVLHFRRKVLWIIIAVAICFSLLIFLTIPVRRGSNTKLSSSSAGFTPPSITSDSPDNRQDTGLVEISTVQSNQAAAEKKPVQRALAPDQAAEVHRKMASDLNGEIREATRRLYAPVVEKLGLPLAVQEKVMDVLTRQQNQLEQEAFDAAQSDSIPAPPTPEEIRAQQDQQNQQLRSILGDAGFAQFTQVQATIPARLLVDAVNQQGGNLSEGQSQQLLQILTEARQQIVGQSDITQNLGSMSPGDVTAIMQQQQVLLQQTINSRIQNLLTPEQARVLQDVLMRHSVFPRDAAF